jgi:hypothetical protein
VARAVLYPRIMAPRPYEIPEGGATVLVERATRRDLPLLVGIDETILCAVGAALGVYPVALHAFSFRPARALMLVSVRQREALWRFTGRVFKRIADVVGGGSTWTARSHVQVLDAVRVLGATAWVHAAPGVDSAGALHDRARAAELASFGIELTPLLFDIRVLDRAPSLERSTS